MVVLFPTLRGAALALIAAAVAPSWATDSLTLAQALHIAVGRSPQLRAQQALGLAAAEQAVAAGQLPDPVLKLGVDNLPVDGPDRGSLTRDFMTMRRIGIMQEIPRAEKRQLRADRFEHDAQRARALQQQSLASIQQSTALAWLERYYAQALRELVQQQIDETRLQLQAADLAFRNGKAGQADVFAARAALIGLEDRLGQIDGQLRSAELMLSRWVGADVANRTLSGSPPWQTMSQHSQDLKNRPGQYPDLQVISAEIAAAETDAQLALADKKPDWSVEASYSQRGSAYSNMVSLGISIPLQWDAKNRQNRELAAKLFLVDEAKERYEDRLRSQELETRSLLNDWQTGKDRLARLRDELIPVMRQRAEASLTAYRTGKSDLAATLAARRDEVDARIQAANLEMETARAWARLNYLTPDQATAGNFKEQP